ncbi:MAG: TolB family protein, partial [Rubrobacter sp.]
MTATIAVSRGRGWRIVVATTVTLLLALLIFAFQADPASAQAEEESYTLNVSTTGSGKTTGPGIDCGNGGTDCTETFPVTYEQDCYFDEEIREVVCEDVPVYQEVTLTASPASGWRLQNWGGACSGTQSTCVLTMNDNHSVSASWVQLPPNGRIAFQTSRDGNDEIYVMNADGTGQTRITNNSEFDRQPAYSPDGTKIAFSGHGRLTNNGDIYVMSANGTGKTFLTDSLWFDGHPVYSPNGSRIAFVSERDGNYEIYAMNADGSGQTNLTNSPTTADFNPSYSPDGQKITFHRDGDIWVMNADGTGQMALTNDPAPDAMPDFSPDGTKIAFTSFRDGNYEIYTMNADGTGETNFTNNAAAQDDMASYSPDATKISFVSFPVGGGNDELYVMNADGTGEPRAVASDAIYASWGPANTSVPETTITYASPAAVFNSTSARFFFSSELDTIFECKLDGGAFAPCESPKEYADLSEGPHTFQVRAINAAGNADPTPATHA